MKFKRISFFITICFIIFIPPFVGAAESGGSSGAPSFIGLIGIPGLSENSTDLNAYINALYRMSISVAALLAVVKIVLAGAKYMLTDVITHKGEAKKDIEGALIGLLIIIGAYLILNTINTDLTHVNFDLQQVKAAPNTPPAPKTIAETNCDTGGGCYTVACDSIGLSFTTYISDGAIGGGLVGATGVLIVGPGGTVTIPGGALIGSIIGGVFYLSQNYVACPTVCEWRYGTMVDSNTCSIPNDKVVYMAAEAANIVATKEAERAALVTECNNNLNNSKCCSISAGNFNGKLCSLGEIVPIPGGSPGDSPSIAELNCITGPGYKWDGLKRVCRATPIINIPVPDVIPDGFINYSQWCNAQNANYDKVKNVCVPN